MSNKDDLILEKIKDLPPLGSKPSKLSKYKLHLSIKAKLDSYDQKFEDKLDPKKYYQTNGIIVYKNLNPEFPRLKDKFYHLSKWSISDYLEYYFYMTQQCRTIEGYRNGELKRLSEGTIFEEEIRFLEKISAGLFKIEKIIADYYLKNKITYEELIGDLDIDIPVVTIESILAGQGNAKLTLSDYIK